MFLIQKIFVMLFRTLAHLFSTHYQDAIAVELHPHLNTLFTHFITFSHTFRLLEPSETASIDELIAVLAHWNTWRVNMRCSPKGMSLDLESKFTNVKLCCFVDLTDMCTRLKVHIKCTSLDSRVFFFNVTWRIPSMFWPSRPRMCQSTELLLNSSDDPAYKWFFSANCEHGQFSFGQWPHGLSPRCNFLGIRTVRLQLCFGNYAHIPSWCVCLPHQLKKKKCFGKKKKLF